MSAKQASGGDTASGARRAARERAPNATAALDAAVTSLPRVGPKLAERLQRLGIERVVDLLFHLPLRYEDRTRVTPIGALGHGRDAVIHAQVGLAQVKLGRRRSLLVRVSDGTGALDLRFFHFSDAQRNGFQAGTMVTAYGTARRGPVGLEMVHPEYRLLADGDAIALEASLTPVYPTTDGLGQGPLRRIVAQALSLSARVPDLLAPVRGAGGSREPTLVEALQTVHAPDADVDPVALIEGRHPAVQRLALEELLAHHLSHREIRRQLDARRAPALRRGAGLARRLRQQLSFSLTGAQERVAAEVETDLARTRPMYRLVQGDVGSGKTVVAALGVCSAVESQAQAAVMAPTELLAEQHFRNFSEWLEPLGVRVAWLGGRQGARSRRDALEALASGQAQVAVGTHALFQDQVRFARLALAVIDEQHRFGVHQRLALLSKAADDDLTPHQLIMTATPIPRTLAMTSYAHLDVSSIDELPPGRTPVETAVLPESRRAAVVERIAKACASGQQAYWVCPLIEESEALEAQAAELTAERLRDSLPAVRVGLAHGRMKSAERDAVMSAFRDARIDLLVATTVIEVGVDVPNASLMIIENAERMGLSQLHQLRGRVGRGARKSACVLLYRGPLGRLATARLGVMRETNDGFVIAAKDLELRGPGEVLGTRQTGAMTLRVADLARDHQLVTRAVELADALMARAPEAARALVRRWVGAAVSYGEVG